MWGPDGETKKGRNLYLFSEFTASSFFVHRYAKTPKLCTQLCQLLISINVFTFPLSFVSSFLFLQQSLGHWMTLIWKFSRNRLHASTSNQISTLEKPQVRFLRHLSAFTTAHTTVTICVTWFPALLSDLCWCCRHKGGRTNKTHVEGTHLHLKSILRPEFSPCTGFVFTYACVYHRCLTRRESTFFHRAWGVSCERTEISFFFSLVKTHWS